MLLDSLQADLANAQKSRDTLRVDTLRFLLGAVFNLQIEKYPPGSEGHLSDADVQSVIARQIKTHQESIEMFKKGGRNDLVERETAELAILQTFMPAQMNAADVKAKVKQIVDANPGADFGTLMKLAMGELRGKADGSVVSAAVKELLNV